jgi:topoisomerase-4 subunit B
VEKLGKGVEITRFKGLGEASPEEFATFIGPKIKLDPVTMSQLHNIDELLSFYMGKNTPERQGFIIENLQVEKDLIEGSS